jgi:hypothetical protein
MAVFELGKVEWLNFLRCPLTKQNKEDTPLFTYGNLVKCPEPGSARGFLHAIAGNIESYNAIQLDYDEFVTLDGFIREFKDQFAFWAYTTYNYGFKKGDRFRVVIPLAHPLPASMMGPAYCKTMMKEFPGCDPSCFAQAHFQALPCVRKAHAPFRYHINSHARRYDIPVAKVAAERKSMERLRLMDLAVARFRAQFDGEDDEANRVNKQIAWAQRKFDEAKEGNRNNTMFSTLMYLVRQNVPAYRIAELVPPSGSEDEWERMLIKIY